MVRVLILEDDPVALKMWHIRIRQQMPGADISMFPSVDHLADKLGAAWDNVGAQFDIIVTDIFLSGETTGLEFIRHQSLETQSKTIITSSITVENFEKFSKAHGLNCIFVQKPLNQKEVSNAILKIAKIKNINEIKIEKMNPLNQKKLFAKHDRPVFFVTGCSSGVGAALAKQLVANEYYRVVLTARPKSIHLLKEKYQENDRVMIMPMQMTDVAQVQSVVLAVLRRWGRIDVLVNNAGICYRSVIEQMDLASEENQMKTNYMGPISLIREVVSVMRENGRGKIINVSSVSGVMGMPTMGSYTASKHALEGVSESLWYELRPFGVNVTVVRPGFINNEGHSHVAAATKAQLAEELKGPYSDFYVFMRPFVSMLMRISPQTSENIADKIMSVVKTQNPPLWVNATFDAQIFSFLRWILPEFFFHKLMNVFFLRAAKWGHGYSQADQKRMSA
jgi:short-subunit dehydrogenase/CheY-like chemotaxis protein